MSEQQEKLAARKKAKRDWYAANHEKQLAYKRAYRTANKEKIAANKKSWYEANKERALANKKAYYEANKEKMAPAKKAYREAHKEHWREYHRQYHRDHRDTAKSTWHGLTNVEKRSMAEQQNYCCAICGRHFERLRDLNVDHVHTSSQIRELLCSPCNFLLGNAKEDVTILQSAINYLSRHNGTTVPEEGRKHEQ